MDPYSLSFNDYNLQDLRPEFYEEIENPPYKYQPPTPNRFSHKSVASPDPDVSQHEWDADNLRHNSAHYHDHFDPYGNHENHVHTEDGLEFHHLAMRNPYAHAAFHEMNDDRDNPEWDYYSYTYHRELAKPEPQDYDMSDMNEYGYDDVFHYVVPDDYEKHVNYSSITEPIFDQQAYESRIETEAELMIGLEALREAVTQLVDEMLDLDHCQDQFY